MYAKVIRGYDEWDIVSMHFSGKYLVFDTKGCKYRYSLDKTGKGYFEYRPATQMVFKPEVDEPVVPKKYIDWMLCSPLAFQIVIYVESSQERVMLENFYSRKEDGSGIIFKARSPVEGE